MKAFSLLFVLFLLCVSRVEACALSTAAPVHCSLAGLGESFGAWEDEQSAKPPLKWTWDDSTGTLIVSGSKNEGFDLRFDKEGSVSVRKYKQIEWPTNMTLSSVYTAGTISSWYTSKLKSKPEIHKFKTEDETLVFSSTWNGDFVLITGSTINDFKVYPDGTVKRRIWEDVK